MAFRDILTPILGPDAEIPKSETTVEFMNMKFAELLDNTKDNRQQISISLERSRVLEADRGYKDTKISDGVSCNTLLINGKYKVSNGTDTPDGSNNSTFVIDVTAMSSLYVTQKAYCLYSPLVNTAKTYKRMSINGVFGVWKEEATTDKIDISLLNGWVNHVGNDDISKVEKIGSAVVLSITAMNGTLASGTLICSIPSQFRPSVRQMFFADAMTNVGAHLGRVFVTLTSNGNLTTGSACPVGTTFLIVKVSYVL